MAHPFTRRRGLTGDKTHHRLFNIGFDPCGGLFFRAAADLADHDHRFGSRIVIKQCKHIDELESMHRIATDVMAGSLYLESNHNGRIVPPRNDDGSSASDQGDTDLNLEEED